MATPDELKEKTRHPSVMLQDGQVEERHLRDSSVTEGKLAFDPATQAELDAHATHLNGHVIEESGTPLTQRANLNFTNGLVAADNNPDTEVRADYGAVTAETTFGAGSSNGVSAQVSRADHQHGNPTNPVTAHEAAGDPHNGYRLESADHSHQSTGLQAGQLDHGAALAGLADDDHGQYLKEKASGGTAAEVPTHTHEDAANAGTVSHDVLTGVSPDDHHAQVHGAADHTDVSRFLWIPAGSITPDTAAVGLAGTAPDRMEHILFNDGSTQGAVVTFLVPQDWASGAIGFTHYFSGNNAFGAADTFRVETTVAEISVSEDTTSAGTTTAEDITPGTAYAANDLIGFVSSVTITPGDPVALIRFYFRRLGGHANDDYVGNLRWHGMLVGYTAVQ